MVNIKRYNSKDKKINIDSAKWHAGDHTIEKPMDYSDMESITAGTFESFHKYSITGNYEKTSRRQDTCLKEMGTRIQQRYVQRLDRLSRNIVNASGNIQDLFKSLDEDIRPKFPLQENCIFSKASNARKQLWIKGINRYTDEYMHLEGLEGFQNRMDEFLPIVARNNVVMEIITGIHLL